MRNFDFFGENTIFVVDKNSFYDETYSPTSYDYGAAASGGV
jgi:hypothetical protein